MSQEQVKAAQRVLIIGGVRSGKSALAERLLADETEVHYVATSAANPADPEWGERIADHQNRRPQTWRTIESMDAAGLLREQGPPVLIDCLTVWLTRVMDRHDAWNDAAWPVAEAGVRADIDDLAEALKNTVRRVVIVTNEVGQGIVPTEASVRRFRDYMGWTNQRIASISDEVAWSVAGRFVRLEAW